ncbi:hypothetical protein BH11BAC2_BH11BAC2_23110 [soil metagenome]
MKKNLFYLLLLLSFNTFAQDIEKINSKFEYQRLPLKPLNKDVKAYSSKVIMAYADKMGTDKASAEKKYESEMEDYNKKVSLADEQFKIDMAAYDIKHKEAEDQYQKELAEWKEKSTGKRLMEKTMLNETKPQPHYPSYPYKNYPVRPVYVNPESVKTQKIFNTEALASTYIKLDGYPLGKENAVNITVTMLGIEMNDPVLEMVERSEYNSASKASVPVKYYSYSLSYKHPMSVRLETKSGVILDEYLEVLNSYKTAKSGTYKTQYDLEQWWSKSKDGYIATLAENAATGNLKYIDSLLNSNYGYTQLKRETDIRIVKDSKMNYSDFQEAYESATAGYTKLADDPAKKDALPEINKAIELWEAALKESNPADKKARIDADVTMALYFNLIEGYIWADEYDKASKLLAKMNAMDPSKKERREGEELSSLLKDLKFRYDANY